MYRQGEIHEPYSEDDYQDMWVGSIDHFTDDNDTSIDHQDCIEVRADTEELLKFRMNVIVKALNNERTNEIS